MGARESQEMKKARKLVQEEGWTPYSAGRHVGLSHSAIYIAPWYKKWKEAQRKAKEWGQS